MGGGLYTYAHYFEKHVWVEFCMDMDETHS